MKRNVMYLLMGVAIATGVAAAQGAVKLSSTTLLSQDQKSTDLMLTGCVTQGSAPTVFILDNAKTNPSDDKEKGRVFLLVATDDLALAKHVNHEVTVTGSADARPAPPAGQKTPEKDLPKFSAKSLVLVADKCSATAR